MEVAIVEDEKLASNKLIMLLESIDENISVKSVLTSVSESKKWFATNDCDLIFMDINLSDDLSFNIFKEVEIKVPIIFTTAYDEYAIKAFEQNSIAYLLKPIDLEELKKSLNKFYELNKRADEMVYRKLSSLVGVSQGDFSSPKGRPRERFTVNYGGKIRSIATKDISFFFVKGGVVYLVTHAGSKYIMDQTLEKIEKEINSEFFRVNRQFLIHIDSIDEVIPYSARKLKIKTHIETEDSILVPTEKITKFKNWFEGKEE